MPTHALLGSYPTGYKAPKKYVLVLSCVDARLLDDLVSFLDHDNLSNRYYHVTLPGTALGLTEHWKEYDPTSKDEEEKRDGEKSKKKGECRPCYVFNLEEQFARWRLTFIDQVRAAIILTEGYVTDIYIIQHEDCGAFREFIKKDSSDMKGDEEICLHSGFADALMRDISCNFQCDYNPQDSHGNFLQEKIPRLHAFYMDLRGDVTKLSEYAEEEPEEIITVTATSGKKKGKKKKAM